MKLLALFFALTAISRMLAVEPVVIAHRGASGYLPEHTLAAKAMAHAMNVDFIEQDIVLTKDNVPVVLHDIHLDTVTDVAQRFPNRNRVDGRYYVIDFTLAEVKQLHVSERFNFGTKKAVYPQRFPVGQSEFRVSTLEEELQLIQGLNRSRGRDVGIYPEIKQPQWHRGQGRDLSAIVLPILRRYGYATKAAACYLQCFDLTELRRIRTELGWEGRTVMLITAGSKGEDGTDYHAVCTPDGLKDLAKVADGIGPALSRVVNWKTPTEVVVTDLVASAHAAGLVVHPYVVRTDDLPRSCPSTQALHEALFRDAKVDGVFTDFPDVTVAWLKTEAGRR